MKTNKTSDLARAISERYDISAREATTFLLAMVDIINEALQYEKQVKIKGLGTFKLTSVSARESIDVTTGERISIDGREKITFTPDASLRDRVNAPFAQFDTFVINDGVDFSDIDGRYSLHDDAANLSDEPLGKAANEQPEAAIPAEPVVAEVVPLVPVNVGEAPEEETPEIPSQEEPSEVPQEKMEAPEAVEDTEKEDARQEVALELQALQKRLADLHEDKLQIEENLRKTRQYFNFLLLALLLLIGGGAACIAYQFYGATHSTPPLQVVTVEKDTTSVAATLSDDSLEMPTDSLATIPVVEPPADAGQPQETDSSADYDRDPRIRLGAYRIVGIDRQVTVLRGQTFQMISRAHLGEGMECYMEAVNPGVKIVKEGDQLNIPKLQLKKKQR